MVFYRPMKLAFFLLSICLFSSLSFAQFTNDILGNDREGKSYYQKKKIKRLKLSALTEFSAENLVEIFKTAEAEMNAVQGICAFDVLESFNFKLKTVNPKFNNLEGALHVLRDYHLDDITLSVYLSNLKALQYEPEIILAHSPFDPQSLEALDQINASLDKFGKEKPKACLDQSFRQLMSQVKKADATVDGAELASYVLKRTKNGEMSSRQMILFEKARFAKLDEISLTLTDYYKKKNSIRVQFSLPFGETSDFVTQAVKKAKKSLRQNLYQTYDFNQIMVMGKAVKNLRERLDSSKVEILVYDKQNSLVETMALDEQERFRFAIKALRKEMHLLSSNIIFASRQPTYVDLMAAAYEMGIVTAEEIDEVASLQEIWDPKKTFWDKASRWIRLASSVGAILLPPPLGYIPVLALIAIEATTTKKNKLGEFEHSLF